MAALSPHRFIAAWQVEAPFSAVSLFDGSFNWPSLGPLPDSHHVVQPAKDIGLICYKTLPTKSVTCLQVGPCLLSGRRLYLQDPTNPALHFPRTGRRSPCSSTFTLEQRCSSTTSSTTRWCRLEHVCPYSWWWSRMCHLEHKSFGLLGRFLPQKSPGSWNLNQVSFWNFLVRWCKATQMQEDQPYAFRRTYCLTMLLLKKCKIQGFLSVNLWVKWQPHVGKIW